jgi:hypothetical protein
MWELVDTFATGVDMPVVQAYGKKSSKSVCAVVFL